MSEIYGRMELRMTVTVLVRGKFTNVWNFTKKGRQAFVMVRVLGGHLL